MGNKTESEKLPTSRSETLKHIRAILGRTQKEMSVALGIAEKTVQSYEQGWRDVPSRVMIQLLVLLALYRRQTMDDVPCWEIRECSPEQREQCASFQVSRGQFCWFVGAAHCHPRNRDGDPGPILPCMQCPVIKRLLAGQRIWTNHGSAEAESEGG